ncbi:MAG: S1C family serine protease [Dehalococcoidia bacterium]
MVRIDTPLGSGSGAIFETEDESANILTNYHVIAGATNVSVTVNDLLTYEGTILGIDPLRDLAVLTICCSAGFMPLPFGDAGDLPAGTDVIAMGYPLGIAGEATVTRGIVSAIRYESEAFRWLIQTDTPINPGNSGGPLLSTSGEILGINTFVIRSTGSGISVEGFGFAISEVTVREVLPDLAAGTFVAFPTPTPQPKAPGGIYTSPAYWYTIEVPSGWSIDAEFDDAVAIWDPGTGATIWVVVDEIDPLVYPTLDSYVAAWQPAPAEGWTDFEITYDTRIRTGLPVEAHEFGTSFTDEGGFANRIIDDWYVLGSYQVSVQAIADESVWSLGQYSEVREALEQTLASFQPVTYTSSRFGYSVAIPLDWTEGELEGRDYYAFGPSGTLDLYVEILPTAGYGNISDYGADAFITVAPGRSIEILSRGVVYGSRPNPSYRMDYTITIEETGELVKGAVLITLGGGNAIWVFVEDYTENWPLVESLVDDIFLRVAVLP